MNISFYSSILYCCLQKNKNYNDYNSFMSLMESFLNKLKKDLDGEKIFTANNYFKLYSWKKKEIKDPIIKKKITDAVIQYVADYMYINIWVFDDETNNIICYPSNCNNKLNMYFRHIVLFRVRVIKNNDDSSKKNSKYLAKDPATDDDNESSGNCSDKDTLLNSDPNEYIYTPISREKKRIFSYKTSIIKKILSNGIIYRASVNRTKKKQLKKLKIENFTTILNEFNYKKNDDK